jgi:GTPase SAR1 family protein
MYKNIFIIGPGRSGKTTLAKMINKKYGYSIISIDDIVTSLETFSELDINWKTENRKASEKMAPFLIKYIKELSEGNKFYDGCKCVIEGTDVDFEKLIPNINQEKTLVIGLTYNDKTKEDLFNSIRKYDTEDDWSYYLSDDELMEQCNRYIEINSFFNSKLKEYNIPTFDTSFDREKVLNYIMDNLEDLENGKKDTN